MMSKQVVIIAAISAIVSLVLIIVFFLYTRLFKTYRFACGTWCGNNETS
jgi:hypothetical protein